MNVHHTFVIWRKIDDNTLYYESDSGCSCPTPFENVDEIIPITNETIYGFNQAIENHSFINKDDLVEIKRRVKEHLGL